MTPLSVAARRTFASLELPNYRRYFAGMAVSQAGTWMQTVAQAWLVLDLSGSGTWLGVTLALQFLPVLLVGPYAGLLVDRASTRRVLVVTQSAMAGLALVLGVLTVTDVVTLPMVLALAAATGVATAFDSPARQAFVREMVPPDHVRNAVSLNAVLMNVARAVGPAVGGVLIATVGVGACFLVNAASFGVVIVAFLLMDAAALRPPRATAKAPGQLREGFSYVRRTPSLRVPLLMMTVIGALTYEFGVVLPVLARTTFDGGPQVLGWMSSAFGVGAILGGLWSAGRTSHGVAPLVRAAAAFGLAVLAAAVMPSLELTLAALAAAGATSVAFLSTGNSTLQLSADPRFRGRVMALWTVAFFGTTPLGGPVVGSVAEHLGARYGLLLGGLAALTAAGLGALALRPGAGTGSPAGDAAGRSMRCDGGHNGPVGADRR